MVISGNEFREHFAKLGRRGGKARLSKMSALQRQEVARNAAEARWKKSKLGELGERSTRECSPATTSSKPVGQVPVYPLIVKNPPLRVRLVCDALKQKGFQVADRAWHLGDFVHLEFSTIGRPNSTDDPRQLISKSLSGVGVRVDVEQIRVFEFGKKLVVPVRLSRSATLADFVHSADYHTIEYEGHLYTLPDRAAAMIRFLHEAYTQQKPWCSAQAIRARLQMGENQRIDHLFRRQDGPQARKDLICSDPFRRRYRLNLPDSL
jgi:hypothetical protein